MHLSEWDAVQRDTISVLGPATAGRPGFGRGRGAVALALATCSGCPACKRNRSAGSGLAPPSQLPHAAKPHARPAIRPPIWHDRTQAERRPHASAARPWSCSFFWPTGPLPLFAPPTTPSPLQPRLSLPPTHASTTASSPATALVLIPGLSRRPTRSSRPRSPRSRVCATVPLPRQSNLTGTSRGHRGGTSGSGKLEGPPDAPTPTAQHPESSDRSLATGVSAGRARAIANLDAPSMGPL